MQGRSGPRPDGGRRPSRARGGPSPPPSQGAETGPLVSRWAPRARSRRAKQAMAFVHLHTHSEYSLLDGANRIVDLVRHVKTLGMDSLAVTDHGNLHAAWAFYDQAKSQKLR